MNNLIALPLNLNRRRLSPGTLLFPSVHTSVHERRGRVKTNLLCPILRTRQAVSRWHDDDDDHYRERPISGTSLLCLDAPRVTLNKSVDFSHRPIQFHCQVCSIPSAYIEWMRNGVVLVNNQYFGIELKSVDDESEDCIQSILTVQVSRLEWFQRRDHSSTFSLRVHHPTKLLDTNAERRIYSAIKRTIWISIRNRVRSLSFATHSQHLSLSLSLVQFFRLNLDRNTSLFSCCTMTPTIIQVDLLRFFDLRTRVSVQWNRGPWRSNWASFAFWRFTSRFVSFVGSEEDRCLDEEATQPRVRWFPWTTVVSGFL